MRRSADSLRDVPRPPFTARTDAQRKALAEAVRLAKRAAEAEEAMWAAILRARELDVPDQVLCDETGQSRATLNRRYGSRSAPKKAI